MRACAQNMSQTWICNMTWRCARWMEGRKRHAAARSEADDDDSSSDIAAADNAATDEEAPPPGTASEGPGKTGGVKEGHEGRARLGRGVETGVSKAGGYDETPKRRGPQRRKGTYTVRIRYVEDDKRGGGTTEQGMRM